MGLNNECFGKQMHDLNTRKLLVPNILDWSYCLTTIHTCADTNTWCCQWTISLDFAWIFIMHFISVIRKRKGLI